MGNDRQSAIICARAVSMQPTFLTQVGWGLYVWVQQFPVKLHHFAL